MQITVSITSVNTTRADAIKKLNSTDCDYIHVDVMDGIFVSNKQLLFEEFNLLSEANQKPLDIHLMVEEPESEILNYLTLNPRIITIHTEIKEDIVKLINLIKSHNVKAGLAINPETSVDVLTPYFPIIDHILVMSVHPGAGGQEFIMDTTQKIEELKQLRDMNNYRYTICVDGGVNIDTINYVQAADMVVSGSYICKADNYQERIDKLR